MRTWCCGEMKRILHFRADQSDVRRMDACAACAVCGDARNALAQPHACWWCRACRKSSTPPSRSARTARATTAARLWPSSTSARLACPARPAPPRPAPRSSSTSSTASTTACVLSWCLFCICILICSFAGRKGAVQAPQVTHCTCMLLGWCQRLHSEPHCKKPQRSTISPPPLSSWMCAQAWMQPLDPWPHGPACAQATALHATHCCRSPAQTQYSCTWQ
jgi:hypothetical protein